MIYELLIECPDKCTLLLLWGYRQKVQASLYYIV